jgi:putative peptidoglycan lipid II flippase
MIKRFDGAMYSLHAAALLIGAAGLLSRLLGVVRDRLLAAHFGASRSLDIYYVAFQVPDFLYTVFLLGAGSAAIIPLFVELRAQSDESARRFLRRLTALYMLGAFLVSLLAIFFSPRLVAILTPGFEPDALGTSILLTRIMIIGAVFHGLSSIASAAVQSLRRFFVFAIASLGYNLGIIAGIILFVPFLGLRGLAFGVVGGAFLQFVMHSVFLSHAGFGMIPGMKDIRRPWREDRRAIARVFSSSFPRVLAMSISEVIGIILVAMASLLNAGSIAVFRLSSNLHALPVGIFGISFGVAVFPKLCEHAFAKNGKGFSSTLSSSLRAVLFWVVPMTVFFYVLRAHIVRLALGAGNFDWGDTRLTAASLGIFSFAIAAESLIQMFTRSFYALGNTKIPLRLSLASAGFTVGAAWVLPMLLRHPDTFFGDIIFGLLRVKDIAEGALIIGIVVAFVLGRIAHAFFLARTLRQEMARSFGKNAALGIRKEAGEIIFASLTGGMASFLLLRLVNAAVTLDTFLGVFIQGGIAFVGGFLVYAFILTRWGNHEARDMIETVRTHMVRLRVLPQEFDSNGKFDR